MLQPGEQLQPRWAGPSHRRVQPRPRLLHHRGYRYRGVSNPTEIGTYFYGDYCSGRIWGAVPDGGNSWTATERLDTDLRIGAFGEDETGELLVAHLASGTAGAVYRLVNPVPDRTLTITRDGSGTGTVTSAPPGITCGATCSASYPEARRLRCLSRLPAARASSTI